MISERDWETLYIHADTYNCILQNKCVPCLYKVFPSGRNLPPNVRPELCPRSKLLKSAVNDIYPNIRNVLTLGDGDFSFSLSLVNSLSLSPKSNTFNFSDTWCTSYESEESVHSIYPISQSNIHNINNLGVHVQHNVDATSIQSSIPIKPFDIIIWNFPCIARECGADGQVIDIEENKNLIKNFFISAQQYLSNDDNMKIESEIHVSHKTIEPFCWWNIVDIALSCGLYYKGSYIFDKYLFPGYVNKKALDNKSFTCFDAVTYIFTKNPPLQLHSLENRHNFIKLNNSIELNNICGIAGECRQKSEMTSVNSAAASNKRKKTDNMSSNFSTGLNKDAIHFSAGSKKHKVSKSKKKYVHIKNVC